LPKPAQQPHPPVILGGIGPRRGPALAAEYAAEYNVAFHPIDVAARQFERVDRACTEFGRDPATMLRSVALTVAVGRDDSEVSRRALAIGRDVEELRVSGLAGTPAEVLDRISDWREQTRATRLYLQVLDLADLDHIELIAAELAPQLR
jgi:alkanesulfonate monooxygenase